MPNRQETSSVSHTKIHQSDIWEFVIESKWYFVETDLDNVNEYVFEIRFSPEDLPVDDRVAIRWYTSVDKETGVSRPYGTDAMRFVLIHQRTQLPITKRRHGQRIDTWRKNARKKIRALEEKLSDIPRCPECGGVLVIVPTSSGKRFRGCSNYYTEASCSYSKSL